MQYDCILYHLCSVHAGGPREGLKGLHCLRVQQQIQSDPALIIGQLGSCYFSFLLSHVRSAVVTEFMVANVSF